MLVNTYFLIPNFKKDIQLLIVINSKYLDINSLEYQQVQKDIGKIKRTGIELYAEEHKIRIFHKGSKFYIEAITDSKDISNRPAKIVIYGKIPNLSVDYKSIDWSFEICQELKTISKEFDRILEKNQVDAIDKNLLDIYHKYRNEKIILYILKLFYILIIPSLIIFIIYFFFDNIDFWGIVLIISISNLILTFLIEGRIFFRLLRDRRSIDYPNNKKSVEIDVANSDKQGKSTDHPDNRKSAEMDVTNPDKQKKSVDYPIGSKPIEIDVTDPDKRRVIMILPGTEIEQIRYGNYKYKEDFNKSGVWLVEDNLELYNSENRDFLQSLKDQRLLQEGNILIQSSENPSLYFKADDIKEKIVKSKWTHFAIVCHHLGATNWKITTTTETSSTANANFQINISYIAQKLNIVGNSYRKEVFKQVSEIKAEAAGSPPDIVKAKEYVQKYNLYNDEDIRAIREFLDAKNRLHTFEHKMNLLKEVEVNLELAASLRIPQSTLKVLPTFERHVKRFQKFSIIIKVNFPEKIPGDF